MALRLVSFELCPFVHRSAALLHEKGIAFDLEYVDLKNKPAWFLAISPRGKVPLLVTDGEVLFESAVINEFLDEIHAPRLLPDDPFERARQRAWIEVANDLFVAQYKVTSAPARDEYEQALLQLGAVAGRFEEVLSGDYFAEHFGLVNVATAPALFRLVLLEARASVRFFERLPKVEAWARRLAARRSVTAGVLADFESRYLEYLRQSNDYFARELLHRAPASSFVTESIR